MKHLSGVNRHKPIDNDMKNQRAGCSNRLRPKRRSDTLKTGREKTCAIEDFENAGKDGVK